MSRFLQFFTNIFALFFLQKNKEEGSFSVSDWLKGKKRPDKGVFTVVYEREDVSELKIGLSHLILKVTNVGVPGHEDKRYLELGAVNYPSPYGAGCVMGYGTTQDILVRLQDVQLLEDLMKKVPKLIEDIEYEEMHPYG